MDFHLMSYAKHRNLHHAHELLESWKNFDTVDYWRHERMYKNILPVLNCYPKSSWLTLGDGRYGTDANFLIRHGAEALATDINISLLIKAKEDGFIKEFKLENAEELSLEDSQFDFVLCKESYHHFPRPMVALYEMLRVCRVGVVLIEPKDHEIINPFRQNLASISFWFFQSIKNLVKRALGRPSYLPLPNYESVGNFVYSISHRELEKFALGLNLPCLAVKDQNDFYLEGVEKELISANGPLQKTLLKRIKTADKITKKRQEESGLLVAVIFKNEPIQICKDNLRHDGFYFQELARNPYMRTV